MKRSEMVEIGERIIKLLRSKDWTSSEISSKILEEFEEAGMIPPTYVRRLNVDELDELGANNIGFYLGYEHINEWEPEDE